MRPDTMTRLVLGSAALGVVSMMLAGCMTASIEAAPASTAPASPSSSPSEPPTAAAIPVEPRLSDLAKGTRIAEGRFDDPNMTGGIAIFANGTDHGFDVALTGMSPVPPAGTSIEFNAVPASGSDEELHAGFSFYSYDELQPLPDQRLSLPRRGYGGFASGDPSYLRTAVLWAAPEGVPVGLGTVIATAPLVWETPPTFPDLHIRDHGSAEAARGGVSVGDDDVPLAYRVAAGDTAGAIAARFGISDTELAWLNPDRDSGRFILADSTLNLSREHRGLRH